MCNWLSELERLRGKALFFEAQANSSLDGIIVVDETGKKVYQNQRCNELWNLPPEVTSDPDDTAQVRYVLSLVKDPEAFGAAVRRLYEHPELTDRTEVELLNGTVLDRYSAPVYDSDRRYYGRIWTFRDITERKRSEEALRRAHSELEERVAQRTEALTLALAEVEKANRAQTEFLSRMSHELRTPLNAILGFGQLLELDDITDLQKESVRLILKAGNHLLGLINEILDLAGLESGKLTPEIEAVSVGDAIGEMCALVSPMAASRRVEISTVNAESWRYFVLADGRRLRQVLINLLSNGIKYNKPGGKLAIKCEEAGRDRIRITVSDTGDGISQNDIEKLFTPFERLDAYNTGVEGTGLGLVIAQRLIAAMSGSIEVKSQVGVGSTFVIELPAAGAVGFQDGDVRSPADKPDKGSFDFSATVLCIEDNESNLKLVEAVLQSKRNAELISAASGVQGIEMARDRRPDLVLLDLNLPDIHGYDVLGELRSDLRTRDIPVVVISADATKYQIDRMMAGGAEAYLTKPLDLRELLQTFDEMVGRLARAS